MRMAGCSQHPAIFHWWIRLSGISRTDGVEVDRQLTRNQPSAGSVSGVEGRARISTDRTAATKTMTALQTNAV